MATNARAPCQHGEHYDYIFHHYSLSNIPQDLPLLELQQHKVFYLFIYLIIWKQIEQNSIARGMVQAQAQRPGQKRHKEGSLPPQTNPQDQN